MPSYAKARSKSAVGGLSPGAPRVTERFGMVPEQAVHAGGLPLAARHTPFECGA